MAETENTDEVCARRASTMLDLPTPEGPEMTMSLELREVFKEGLALV